MRRWRNGLREPRQYESSLEAPCVPDVNVIAFTRPGPMLISPARVFPGDVFPGELRPSPKV